MRHRPRAQYAAAVLLLAVVPRQPVAAQASQPAAATDTSRHAQLLFTRGDAALALGFAGLTVALFPADRYIARHLRDQTTPANRFLDRSAHGLEVISTPGAYIVAPAIYGVGVLTHHPDVADLGWHGTESVVLATGVTGVLKGLLGRSRPYVSADTNPHDFRFGHGFSGEDRSSFPSGHTTVAFAAASSVTSEAQRIWPGHTWLVAPVMYGGAALVGLSRMYHNLHWASDVVLGAGIGTFSGLKVVR